MLFSAGFIDLIANLLNDRILLKLKKGDELKC
jgi:hypothetical protein